MLRLEVWGKLLLLVAGLPAAIDLIKPETLRRWSEQSDRYLEQRKEFQIVAGIARLQYVIRLDFIRATSVATLHGPIITGEGLHRTPPNRSPVPGVSAEKFASFWEEVMNEVRERPATPEKEAAGAETNAAIRHVERRIDEFLRATLPPDEGEYVGKIASYKASGSRQVLRQLNVLLVILLVAAVVLAIIPSTRSWMKRPVDDLAVPLVITAFLLGIAFYSIQRAEFPGSIESVLLRCAAALLKWFASPLRPLRWIALCFFVAGSMIELVLVI